MAFDLQPHLENDWVELRPMEAGDFDTLFAVASDPLIWEQHPASDRYQSGVFRAFFDAGMECAGALVIVDRAAGEIIGASRYYDLDETRPEITIGYTFLARSHWGGPYNRATKQLMLDHAFRFVDTVALYAGADNMRSCRAIEKIGGVRDGAEIITDTGPNYRFIVRKMVPA